MWLGLWKWALLICCFLLLMLKYSTMKNHTRKETGREGIPHQDEKAKSSQTTVVQYYSICFTHTLCRNTSRWYFMLQKCCVLFSGFMRRSYVSWFAYLALFLLLDCMANLFKFIPVALSLVLYKLRSSLLPINSFIASYIDITSCQCCCCRQWFTFVILSTGCNDWQGMSHRCGYTVCCMFF